MWTPLRQLRRDVNMTMLDVQTAAKSVTRTTVDAAEVVERVGTDAQQHASDLYRRYNRLADTIEAAVIVLTVVAVACTVATTIKELWSE